jgi:two-component system response regulator HupR/HoxA
MEIPEPAKRAQRGDELPDAPTTFESRLGAGDLYARVGDHAQALESFLSLWPEVSGLDVLPIARRIAACQARLGRYRESIALLEPIVSQAPDHDLLDGEHRLELGRCQHELGNAYFRAGRLDQAQAMGMRALESLRESPGADLGLTHNLLGGVALHCGDVDLARAHFLKALRRFRQLGDIPNLAYAYNNLGAVHKRSCEWERALEHYHAAYYLQATEGEYQDQGAIHQNLGIVLMKIGRYEEARGHLEKALARAVELGDPMRALRAKLALIRADRHSMDSVSARERIRQCADSMTEPVPEREACILILEEAKLDLAEGRHEAVRARVAPLEHRVRKMSARGDLMLETRLLEATLALKSGEWEEARTSFQLALDLAREDRDRFQETRALFGLAGLAARTGSLEDADRRFQTVEERLRRSGERPALAGLYEWKGDLDGDARGDLEGAVRWYTRARDLWRRMGLERREASLELKMAGALLGMGQRNEAAAMVEPLQARLAGFDRSAPDLAASLRQVAARLEQEFHPQATGIPDGERAFRRLEEILGWDAEPSEKLRNSVMLIAEALEADGAVLCRLQESGLEVVSSLSMGRLEGRRLLVPENLGLPSTGKAEPRVGTLAIEDGPAAILTLPCLIQGRDHLLHLERRGAAPRRYARADLNYAMVLMAEVSRVLRRTVPPAGAFEEEIEVIRHGIYVADIITQDPRMLSILSLIHKIGDSDLTVLLQGETGTGKKLLAHAIHRISGRRDRPFVTVDCAALPDSLLESELFGHRKGSFTGATQDRVGLLEEANGGTIFLDEIDKSGLSVQRRFLHMLDTGEIRPVGSTGYRSLDVRVVCATSCADLRTEVAAGRFLKDLYYRLNDISIQIPPLRERPDDVPLLTECFLDRYAQEFHRELRGVTAPFHAAIRAHTWPGNVRELEKAIRRAVTLADDGGVLRAELLPPAVLETYEATGQERGPSGNLKNRLEAVERTILLETLERFRWNKSRSAAELGLSRKGLKGKIERYGLDRRAARRG